MSRYRLTPEAANDLESIIAHIAYDNPDAAAQVLEAMTEAFEALSTMPHMAPKRARLAAKFPELRFWPIPRYRNYLIFYEPDSEGIRVIRILHAARNGDEILGI